MQRRRFGRDGTASAVGFGCMSFGGFYGPTSESETMRALARALELGVDFWDTANVYGEGISETMIGRFVAEDRSRRSKITLATKFAIRREPDGRRVFDNSPEHIRASLEGSLKRLGVDCLDLYYVHRIDRPSRSRTPSANSPGTSRPGRSARSASARSRPTHSVARAPCTRSRRCSRNIRCGRAIPSSGSFRPAERGDHGRFLAGRTRLLQRTPAGGRDVRREGFSARQSALSGDHGGATATDWRPIWRWPDRGA